MRGTVTIYVPTGYKSTKEFLTDCGLEEVPPFAHAWDAPYNYSYEPVESRAREIFDASLSVDRAGKRWTWVEGGNSLKQDEARQLAREELRSKGHTPVVSDSK